jgi:hypothetical protein
MARQPEEDYPARTVAFSLAGLCTIVAVCAGAVWLGFPFTHETKISAAGDFGPPALETHPVKDFEAWEDHQQDLLGGADGRMPIAQAINAIARRAERGYEPTGGRP